MATKPIVNKGQLEVAISTDVLAKTLEDYPGCPLVIVTNHGTRAYPVRKMIPTTLFDEVTKTDVKAVVLTI